MKIKTKDLCKGVLILLISFLSACVQCDCKQKAGADMHNIRQPQQTAQLKKEIKPMNMLEEIYALPKPRGFDIKDVRYIVEKYITRDMKKQQVIDILVVKNNFEVNKVNNRFYFSKLDGIPYFQPYTTVITINLAFNENDEQSSSIQAFYKIEQ
jgi:hypothetical protein